MMTLYDWIDSMIPFPDEFIFIKYILLSVMVIILSSVALDFFCSIFFAIFRKR